MAAKPKRKPKMALTDKEQSERFKETARELGIDAHEDFGRVVTKIAPKKREDKKGT
jgi:hypothetical protein